MTRYIVLAFFICLCIVVVLPAFFYHFHRDYPEYSGSFDVKLWDLTAGIVVHQLGDYETVDPKEGLKKLEEDYKWLETIKTDQSYPYYKEWFDFYSKRFKERIMLKNIPKPPSDNE